jgi:hypothetical protein
MASMMAPKVVSIWVCWKMLLSTTWPITPRLSSTTTRMFSSDSSRMSEMPSSFLSRTRSAIFSIREALFTA